MKSVHLVFISKAKLCREERKEKENLLCTGSLPQIATIARAELIKSQELFLDLPREYRSPKI